MLEPQFISGRSYWTESLLLNVLLGLPDLTNITIRHPVKFEFQINIKNIFFVWTWDISLAWSMLTLRIYSLFI